MTATASNPPDTREQVLTELRTWMLSLTDEDLAALGVDNSVEEPMRLLRGFARQKGLTIR